MITKYKIFENLNENFWKVKVRNLEVSLFKLNIPRKKTPNYIVT